MGANIVFRRVGGRIIPILSAGLKQAKMNIPAIRTQLAHEVKAARKGMGKFGGRFVLVKSEGRSIHFSVPKKGLPTTVSTMKITGRGSTEPGSKMGAHFSRRDDGLWISQYKIAAKLGKVKK